jgi:hypothetical protein
MFGLIGHEKFAITYLLFVHKFMMANGSNALKYVSCFEVCGEELKSILR